MGSGEDFPEGALRWHWTNLLLFLSINTVFLKRRLSMGREIVCLKDMFAFFFFRFTGASCIYYSQEDSTCFRFNM